MPRGRLDIPSQDDGPRRHVLRRRERATYIFPHKRVSETPETFSSPLLSSLSLFGSFSSVRPREVGSINSYSFSHATVYVSCRRRPVLSPLPLLDLIRERKQRTHRIHPKS